MNLKPRLSMHPRERAKMKHFAEAEHADDTNEEHNKGHRIVFYRGISQSTWRGVWRCQRSWKLRDFHALFAGGPGCGLVLRRQDGARVRSRLVFRGRDRRVAQRLQAVLRLRSDRSHRRRAKPRGFRRDGRAISRARSSSDRRLVRSHLSIYRRSGLSSRPASRQTSAANSRCGSRRRVAAGSRGAGRRLFPHAVRKQSGHAERGRAHRHHHIRVRPGACRRPRFPPTRPSRNG